MNAKEKAIDLFNKFKPRATSYSCDRKDTIGNAKECAKIAVEEILNNSVMSYSGPEFSDNEILSDTEYWNEVLKEIELL